MVASVKTTPKNRDAIYLVTDYDRKNSMTQISIVSTDITIFEDV